MATECASQTICQTDGTSFVIDEKLLARNRTLGVTRKIEDGLSVYTFRVWAPRADSVYLVGDFVGWEKGRPMTALSQGVWEYHLTTEGSLEKHQYKYKLFSRGKASYLADPYAKELEAADHAASILSTDSHFHFQDEAWLKHRQKESRIPVLSRALHFYELDSAAWKTHDSRPVGEPFAALSYRELADAVTPYVKGLGYTHVILSESLFNGVSRFAAPACHGSYDDFLYFINKLHTNGVGILCPILPLEKRTKFFDGVCSNNCPNFVSYLLLTLLHFAECCHVDGFVLSSDCQDDVSIASLLATEIKKTHPELLFLHKGSSQNKSAAFDLVSNTNKEEALRRYLACDPFFRHYHHDVLSFEAHGLLCEPEVTQRSLMAGFFGNYEDKFATMRLFHLFRLFYPAKPISYMGNELAPFAPRDSAHELEWFLLDFPMHRRYFDFVKKANTFYLENAPLWQSTDCRVIYENPCDNVLVIARRSQDQKTLYGVFNFSAKYLSEYWIPIDIGSCREIFSTDSLAFGGSGQENTRKDLAANGGIILDIPPLCAVMLQPVA